VALTHEMGQQQRCGRIPGRDDGFRCLGADQWCHWGVEGTLGCLDGRNHAETKDLPMGKNDSALESLAGREKTGREGAAGGSCWRPRGVTCGTAMKGDLAVSTGCGRGGRCQAAFVTVSCEKTGEVEFGRVGRCGLAVVGLTRYEHGPLSNYSKIFN
jgi:hypothetical protein